MKENDIDEFDKTVANRYLDEKFGSHITIVDMPKKNKEKIRAVRMLVSYQKSGEFEFRCPCVEYIFDGETGEMVIHYLEYCEKDLSYSYKTIENKRLYLHDFSSYLEANSLSFDDLNLEEMEKFLASAPEQEKIFQRLKDEIYSGELITIETISNFEKPIESSEYDISQITLELKGVDFYQLQISFNPWKVGKIQFPSINIADEILDFSPIQIMSIVEQTNTSSLKESISPLLLPNTSYKILGANPF